MSKIKHVARQCGFYINAAVAKKVGLGHFFLSRYSTNGVVATWECLGSTAIQA